MNTGRILDEAARRDPLGRALIFSERGQDCIWTFADLLRRCDAYAHGLRTYGLRPGDRTLLMVRHGPTFIALTFALFKLGALPVLLDPGMGVGPLVKCIDRLQPDVLIGVRKAHLLRAAHGKSFQALRRAVCADGFWPGAASLARLAEPQAGPFPAHEARGADAAAILFTSGSTGPAKGVVYRHEIFYAQVEALRNLFGFAAGEVDMPGFPLFALFSVALGMTSVLPELDPSRPAQVDPGKLVRAIRDWRVTSLQGSPAIWTRVGEYCRDRSLQLPSVKRVVTFGAPIGLGLVRLWRQLGAEIHTPYGATEALPVSTISGAELEALAPQTRAGAGVCVGRKAPGLDWQLLDISDEPVTGQVTPGDVGEVAVSGPVVTHEYDRLPEANAASKFEQEGRIWHRMGDLGRVDDEGRLWIVGRKAHRVQAPGHTFFPVCAEEMVDHPEVRRCALVGVGEPGHQQPTLVVEPGSPRLLKDPAEQHKCARELKESLSGYVTVKKVLFHPSLPVDPRHNAKIDREELARWAATQE